MKKLWKYIFPSLSAILWIITIILFFRSHGSYDTADYEQVMNAMRWQPACCIGAIISTAAAYVIEEIQDYIDK